MILSIDDLDKLDQVIDQLLFGKTGRSALAFFELKRVLKPIGSFWIDIGDVYRNKPFRWISRNEVIWNIVRGEMNIFKDKLGNIYNLLLCSDKCFKLEGKQ